MASSSGGVFSRLEDLRESEAIVKDNYWYDLSTDTERFMADTNKDNIISLEEYRTFLLNQSDKEPNINSHKTDHIYSLDISVLVAIIVVCISSIIVAWILRKR